MFRIKFFNKKTNNDMPNKKYKFKIIYKNKAETTGEITANNLDEVKKTLLDNKYTIVNQNKKLVYYNSAEIQSLEVEEMEKNDNESNDKSTYER